MKVVLLDPTSVEELAFLQTHLPCATLVAPEPSQTVTGLLAGAMALVSKRTQIDAGIIKAAGSGLKLIQLWSGRHDRVDRAAAKAAGVPVALMPQRGAAAVAECTLTLMLGLSKKIVLAHQSTISGAYRTLGVEPVTTAERLHKFQWMQLPGIHEISGQKLGLIGFGEIATEVARRARAFGMELAYWSRTQAPSQIEAEEGVQYMSMEALLSWADVVSLHVPHTEETEKLINQQTLALMKQTAVLINTCRGGVVDESALVSALNNGRIGGAGLDVFAQEPIPHDHPLLSAPNTLLLPHLGGGSGGARVKHAQDIFSNVAAALNGQSVRHLLR